MIDLSRLNTFLLVERFKMELHKVHQGLSDSRGMGVVDRPIRHLPSHPNPPKLKEESELLPQVTHVPFRLPFSLATAPQVFTMIVKEVKLMALTRLHQYLDDWSQKEAPVNTQTVVDLTQSLGWIINQEKSELKPTRVFLYVGYEYHLDSVPCKTPSREMAQSLGFDPMSQVKTCFYCKMFDVANWVACLNGENGFGGTPSHEALSVSPQGALEISSVIGQPPSLDRDHFSTPRVVAECRKCDEGCRSSSQRPQYANLYRRLK